MLRVAKDDVCASVRSMGVRLLEYQQQEVENSIRFLCHVPGQDRLDAVAFERSSCVLRQQGVK